VIVTAIVDLAVGCLTASELWGTISGVAGGVLIVQTRRNYDAASPTAPQPSTDLATVSPARILTGSSDPGHDSGMRTRPRQRHERTGRCAAI
jgi:hypothetical protein